jgi:hypothetical protein
VNSSNDIDVLASVAARARQDLYALTSLRPGARVALAGEPLWGSAWRRLGVDRCAHQP